MEPQDAHSWLWDALSLIPGKAEEERAHLCFWFQLPFLVPPLAAHPCASTGILHISCDLESLLVLLLMVGPEFLLMATLSGPAWPFFRNDDVAGLAQSLLLLCPVYLILRWWGRENPGRLNSRLKPRTSYSWPVLVTFPVSKEVVKTESKSFWSICGFPSITPVTSQPHNPACGWVGCWAYDTL